MLHADTPLPHRPRSQGRIIEPLKDYHKDEVRELGMKLGLPQHLVWRQPFPGPGLAIRTLCATEPYITQEYDATALELQAECARYPQLQLASALLPVRTVGVQGDGRSYAYLAALSSDAPADEHWEALFHLAKEIPGHVHNINRIVYVLGPAIKQVRQAFSIRHKRAGFDACATVSTPMHGALSCCSCVHNVPTLESAASHALSPFLLLSFHPSTCHDALPRSVPRSGASDGPSHAL
jgi:hypothetical protein